MKTKKYLGRKATIFTAFVAILFSYISPISPAIASSSPWSSDSIYGCVGHAIAPFGIVNDGSSPYSVSAGILPAGLNLDASTGEISGTPSVVFSGTFEITQNSADWTAHTFAALIDSSCRPTLSDITPNHGSMTGGTTVSIVGAGFASDATVAFDDAGTLHYLTIISRTDSSRISATTPSWSSTGTVDMLIRNGDGSRLRIPNAFTYETPISVTMYDPADLSTPVTTVNAAHYTNDGTVGSDGKTMILALTGFRDAPNYININFNVTDNPVLSQQNIYCGSNPGITEHPYWAVVEVLRSAPSGVSDTPGTIYRKLIVHTGNKAAYEPCFPIGNWQMVMHLYDTDGKSMYFNFTINEIPGTPTAFTQPVGESFGTLNVGIPLADDPVIPEGGIALQTNKDPATYSLTSGTPLIPDLTVSLYSNGGMGLYASQSLPFKNGGGGGGGSPIVTGTPTRSGPYSFSIAASVSGASPSTYSKTFSGLIIYPTTQTVTFNGNGATSGSMAAQSSNIKALLTANSFARTNFYFNGWSTSPSGGTIIADGSSYEFDVSTNLYAQWIAVPPTAHLVTYLGNGSTSGATAAQSSSVPAAISANGYSRTGYTFDEWNTVAIGNGTIYDSGQTYSFAADMTLYAMWVLNPPPVVAQQTIPAIPHTITYNGNGAVSGSVAPQTANSPTAVRNNLFTRPGYTFHDWNSTTNHSGLEFDEGDIYSFAQDITLYAEWDLIPAVVVTITPDNPLTLELRAGESKSVNVNISGTGGVPIALGLDIPAGIIAIDGRVRITPISSATSLALGLVSVKVEILDTFGAVIPTLLAPLTMHFTTALGQTIVAKSEDGLIWTPIPLITGTALSAGQIDGYYIDYSGKIVILTAHLTQFGFKMKQPGILSISSPVSSTAVNTSISLNATGGTGTGAIGFSTLSTACNVTSTGIVNTLSRGDCWITATKTGDETYMQATSDYHISVVVPPLVLAKVAGTKLTSITIDLGAVRSQTRVELQILPPSVKKYSIIGSYMLNTVGRVVIKKALIKGSIVRFLQDGKVSASAKVSA